MRLGAASGRGVGLIAGLSFTLPILATTIVSYPSFLNEDIPISASRGGSSRALESETGASLQ